MSHLMTFKHIVLNRLGWKTGAILFAAIAALLVLAPKSNGVTRAENCPNPPDHAVLNYWPVSFDQQQTGCTDFTTLDGKIVGQGSYSTSQSDHDNGLDVADDQEAYLLAYVHNGAAQNGDPNKTTARNVVLDVSVPGNTGTDHTVTAAWHGDNTNTASGSFALHTSDNRKIEIVPNSGQLFDSFGNQLASGIDISSGHYTLGDQTACFEFARFFRFKVKVTQVGQGNLSITKQVRNVTTNGTFSGSTAAATGNTVAYEIKVKNTGTAVVPNVVVNDSGTSGTSYVAGSLEVSRQPFSTSGIPGNTSIGDLAPNEEVTISYSATVTGGAGTYTNTATATSGNISVSASATVTVAQPNNDDAECVSILLNPASPFNPGQSFTASVKLHNTGNTTWSAGSGFQLGFPNSSTLTPISLPHPVAPGQEIIIDVPAHAPANAGSYTLYAQLQKNGVGIGNTCQTPVVVTAQVDNADCVSIAVSPVGDLNPNQSFTGTIRVRNSGNTTWQPGTYALGSQNPANNNTWGTSRLTLNNSVAPGTEATFTINTNAPNTPGNYSFAWQMVRDGNYFGATCATPITVVQPPINDAQCISVSLSPSSPYSPNQAFSATIRVRNTGNTTWQPGTYYLDSPTQTPIGRLQLNNSVAPGGEASFTVNTQAPNAAGNYTLTWQMGQNNTFFGATCSTTITVIQPVDNAECISISLNPASPFTPNQAFTGTIHVRNNGNTTWQPGSYALGSQIPANNTIWGTSRLTLNNSVAPGGEATFTIDTHAPSVTGSFTFAWQMVRDNNFFGATCQTPVVVNPVITDSAECISASTAPVSPFTPGQGFVGTIRLRNSGTSTWTPGTYVLGSNDPVDNTTWGTSRINLPNSVAPGQEVTLTLNTSAPTATGTYNFSWQLLKNGTRFGAVCQSPVVVNPAPANGAECISATLNPVSPFNPGQAFTGTIRVRNTGNTTWQPGTYALGSQVPQDNTIWGVSRVNLASAVAPGGEATFTIDTHAPNAAGSFTFAWQMVANNTFFGALCQTPVVVNPPSNNNAECISATVTPTGPFTPGQAFTGTITVRNNGNTTWQPGTYTLGSQNPQGNTTWGVSSITLPNAVPPGGEATFTVNTFAPSTSGSYSFAWQMMLNGAPFGNVCATTVTVNLPNTDNAECISASVAPVSPFTPGQGFVGTIRVRNTGNTTWQPGTYALASNDPNDNTKWGTNRINIPNAVAPGQEVALTLSTSAPATAGTYNFAWQMVNGANRFGVVCQTPVVVNAVQDNNNAECISATVSPTGPFTPGQAFTGTIRVRNTGNTTWQPGTYALGSQIPQDNTIWGTSRLTLNNSVAPGGEATFTVDTHAPNAAGSYTFAWQMVKNSTFFGALCQTPVIVNVQDNNSATCIDVTLSPSSPFTANQAFTGTIRVHNSGNTTWAPGTYFLGSQNPQDNTTWGTSRVSLNSSVAPGADATFTVSTQAPGTAGTYTFAWQMLKENVSWFGPICSTTLVVNPNQPQNTSLSITKFVRNVTTNNDFAKVRNAKRNDTVEYQVKVKNIGAVTATNVTMTDTGTSGTSFVSGSLKGANGTLPGTLNLGNLAVNQEVTLTYRMKVTSSNGTFTNTATADASNATEVSDTAQVVVHTDTNNNEPHLRVTKLVRNLDSGSSSYKDSVSAEDGDRVQFQITVTNTGDDTADNVELDDDLPSNLDLESRSIKVDGDTQTSNSLKNIDLGDLNDGDDVVVTLIAKVNRNDDSCSGTRSFRNIARVTSDNANDDEDDATVTVGCVAGTNVNLSFSKKAWNDTKNVDAQSTTAAREDFITYTLTVTNTGNSDATNYVISDDLSGVLSYADMVDRNGGTLSGNVLSFPAIKVPAGGTVSKTFRVRIKASLSQSLTYQLQNTYGNTVTINVGSVLGASIFTAPKTGASAGGTAAAASGLMVLGFVAYKKREYLKSLLQFT